MIHLEIVSHDLLLEGFFECLRFQDKPASKVYTSDFLRAECKVDTSLLERDAAHISTGKVCVVGDATYAAAVRNRSPMTVNVLETLMIDGERRREM